MNRELVAKTILAQLGGNRFAVMTGAKNLMHGADSNGSPYLSFKLPSRFATNGINFVRVTLTPADDYKVEFVKVWGMNLKTIAVREGVYADTLRSVFTEATGLDTSL